MESAVMSENSFTGEGFSKEPFTGQERAQMRERAKFCDENFVPVKDLEPLRPYAKVAGAIRPLVTIVVSFGIIGGAIHYLI